MRWRLVLLFFISASSLFGQYTSSDFLRSALNDPEVTTLAEQLNYLGTKPYRLSPLQRVEVRSQVRQMNPDFTEVGLRMTASNPWEISYTNKYFLNLQGSLALEQQLALREALTTRYKLVIYYRYLAEVRDLAARHQQLIRDQIQVLERLAGSTYFDADEFVKLKIALVDRAIEFEETEYDLDNLVQEIRLHDSQRITQTLDWENESLLDIREIPGMIDSLSERQQQSAQLEYRRQQVSLAMNYYKLEKANINAGFIQAEYDNRRVIQERNPYNLMMGITLPLVNPNKEDMARRRLQGIEAEQSLKETERMLQTTVPASLQKVNEAIERYTGMEKTWQEVMRAGLPEQLSTMKDGDPLVLLRFRMSEVKLKLLQAKQRRNILLAWIDYLALSDLLEQRPLVNYLSASLAPIEE